MELSLEAKNPGEYGDSGAIIVALTAPLVVTCIDTVGAVPIQVTTSGAVSATMMAPLSPYSPGFFASKDNSIVAQHADYSLVGPASPAKPGETILLYGT